MKRALLVLLLAGCAEIERAPLAIPPDGVLYRCDPTQGRAAETGAIHQKPCIEVELEKR